MSYIPKPKVAHPGLPKNKLGTKMLSKLKLYAGPDHPHQAQNPQPREFGTLISAE